MTDTTATAGKVPWWFWLVCVVGVLWNGFGAFDFLMSALQGDTYYRSMKMTEAQITHMHSYPAWMWAVWFAGTWGGFIGAVLLIMKRKLALPLFVISLAGFLLSLVYVYVIAPAPQATQGMAPVQATIFVGCVFFIWFSWWAGKKGWLR